MPEENGNVETQPQQTNLQIQIQPQGVMLGFPVQLAIDNATMAQLIKAYLAHHPELVQEIAKEALAQKQQELQFLQMVRRSKRN